MITNRPYILTEIKKLTPLVSSFTFKAQDGAQLDFVPGMFAMLQYKDPQTGEAIARAFSIANAPPSDTLEFLVALIHGRLTSKLEVAKVGDIYSVSAPYGQFKFNIGSGTKFLFLAGGTGLAPFLSMLRNVEKSGQKIDGKMLYSVRYPTEIINKEELSNLEQKLGVKTMVTVTRPAEGDGWTGEKGHVNTDMILREVPDFKERIGYICGPPEFVKALKTGLITTGVPEKNIFAEMWG